MASSRRSSNSANASATISSRAADGEGVTLALSNHLAASYAERLGLPSREYVPGEDITLPRSDAAAVISAGYAQVDPEDKAAVAEALGDDPAPLLSTAADPGITG